MNDDIANLESTMYATMEETSIDLLENSLLKMCNNTTRFGKLLAIVTLQISLELLMKCYIIKLYGFEEVLTTKVKNLRISEPENYRILLLNNDIRTLGFNDLRKLLDRKSDVFAPILQNGECPCFGIEYSYLEGEFDKFQTIRNKFVHMGAVLSEEDAKWIENEYFSLVTIFISLLLREIDNLKGILHYQPTIINIDDDNQNLFATPLDIFRRHLKRSTLNALIANDAFYADLWDYASDAYDADCYICTECGKSSLFLNIFDGFSKCICCGNVFHASYTDCTLCGKSGSVIYDEYNIQSNNNIMPGYCYNCKNHMKVYKCPTREHVYSYTKSISYNYDCCKKNFNDRVISSIDYR